MKPWMHLALGAVLLAAALVVKFVWPDDAPAKATRKQQQTEKQRAQRRLDVQRFREDVARRRAKVRALPRPTAAESAPTTTYKTPATTGLLAKSLMSPSCILGPGDMCESLAELVAACDGEDGASCLALAQYLQETPPRPLIANLFIVKACEFGEKTACERAEELKAAPTKPCTEDPYWCGWYAFQKSDEVMLDEACVAGVADACAKLIDKVEDEPALVQRYLAEACQLGNPMACTALGDKLEATDPEQAAAARAIGCAAGFEDACK